MALFRPRLDQTLAIDSQILGFMPHPLFPGDVNEVYAIEGAESVIYQLQELSTAALWALKVAKPAQRGEHIARSVETLRPYSALPGLFICQRVCLTRQRFPQLIATFPDLEFAVLMPWIPGRTWAGHVANRDCSQPYTMYQAAELAPATARVLATLETYQLAHTDIAGGNVVTAPDMRGIQLLDLENIYQPNVPMPPRVSQGTPGYQHRALDATGQWRAAGDRFAGAILLAEMLSWWDPAVQTLTPPNAECLFQPEELQVVGVPRWHAVRDALWALCPAALPLFDQAWASPHLEDCSPLGEWADALTQVRLS